MPGYASGDRRTVMKATWLKIWSTIGLTGLIAIVLWGNLAYMNLRPADPVLPGWEDYSASRFADLMARDEPVLVEIYASWCPTCLLQHRAFEDLQTQGAAPTIRAVRVDYDRDEAFVKAHGFKGTGTLVVFRGGRPIAQAAGLVTPEKIRAFITPYE